MELRVGLGSDLHKLVKGNGLRIGGADVPCDLSCEAKSDGDVVLHALVDALLGATGQGDIGEHFPDETVAGKDSRRFVEIILGLPGLAGVDIINIDCIVDLEQPCLSPWKTRIRESLAGILGIGIDRVGVKAKTAEGLGPVGSGQAIAAQVAVLVRLPRQP